MLPIIELRQLLQQQQLQQQQLQQQQLQPQQFQQHQWQQQQHVSDLVGATPPFNSSPLMPQPELQSDLPVPEASLHSLNPQECRFIYTLEQYFQEGHISQPMFEVSQPMFEVSQFPHLVTFNFASDSIEGRGSSKEDAAKDALTKIEAVSSASSSREPEGRSGMYVLRI